MYCLYVLLFGTYDSDNKALDKLLTRNIYTCNRRIVKLLGKFKCSIYLKIFYNDWGDIIGALMRSSS